ncbi:MAG: V-type ATPase subunit [candidate division WOR-3 bacterium]|nr:V-type ATPase subunit [candidate division WOR-3 bacterium]
MVRLSENPEYGFAVGRVRALETALLDRARYERLVRAPGVREFVAALAETAYSRFLEGGSTDVPQALDKATAENVALLVQYALDPWLLELFRLPAVFHGLKTALKNSLSHNGPEFTIPDELANPKFASRVGAVVAEVTVSFEKERDSAAVDVVMDRLMQELQLQTAEPSEFMIEYLGLHADLENLRTLVRIKAQLGGGGDPRRDMGAAYLPGGRLALTGFVESITEPWDAVVDRFAKAPPHGAGSEIFFEYLEQGTAAVADKRSFTRMERYGREMELGYLRQTRYATFGYEPLVTYFLLQRNEVRNLRQLHAAKLAGVVEETTQELVAYVE